MFGLSLLQELLIVWAVVTGVTIALLFYRSTLNARQEDQLCLSRSASSLEERNREAIRKERRLVPYLYVFVTISVVLLLSVVGTWLWQGLLST